MFQLPYIISSYFSAQGYDQEDALEAFQVYEQSLVVGTEKLTRLIRGTSNDDGDKYIDIKGISDHLLSHALMAKWKRFIVALTSLPETMGPFVILHLDDVTLDGHVADTLLNALKEAPVVRLLLQTCHNGLQFGSNVLKVNTTLEAVGIRGGRFESIYSAIGFARNIMDHPQLSFLTIEKSDIIADDAAFEAVIPALGRIHTVNLTQNRIGSHGATIIANFLATNPHVHELDLTFNWLNGKDATKLAASLETNTNLRKLALKGNTMIKETGITSLVGAMIKWSSKGINTLVGCNHTCAIDIVSDVNKHGDPRKNMILKLAATVYQCPFVIHGVPIELFPRVCALLQGMKQFNDDEEVNWLSFVNMFVRKWNRSLLMHINMN
jgi:hypothetical protein